MDQQLTYIFEIQNSSSREAMKIGRDVSNISRVARVAGQGLRVLGTGLLAATGLALGFAAGLTRALSEQQDLTINVNRVFGQNAQAIGTSLEDLAKQTRRFSTTQLRQAAVTLGEAGIQDVRSVNDLTTLAIEYAERRGGSEAELNKAAQTFAQIRTSASVSPEQLRELGANQEEFYSQLGGILGVSANVAMQQIQAGRVAGQDVLNAVARATAQASGGVIGQEAISGGATISARLAEIQNLPTALAESLDNPEIQGTISTFLGDIITSARALFPVVGSLIKAVQPLIGVIGRVLPQIAMGLQPLFDAITPVIGVFADILGDLVVALLPAFNAVVKAVAPILTLVGNLIRQLLPPFIPVVELVVSEIEELSGLFQALTENLAVGLQPAIAIFTFFLTNVAVPVFRFVVKIFNFLIRLISAFVRFSTAATRFVQSIIGIDNGIADGLTQGTDAAVENAREAARIAEAAAQAGAAPAPGRGGQRGLEQQAGISARISNQVNASESGEFSLGGLTPARTTSTSNRIMNFNPTINLNFGTMTNATEISSRIQSTLPSTLMSSFDQIMASA